MYSLLPTFLHFTLVIRVINVQKCQRFVVNLCEHEYKLTSKNKTLNVNQFNRFTIAVWFDLRSIRYHWSGGFGF